MAAASTLVPIYHPLDTKQKEIRIATIVPNPDITAPIEVNLEVVSLFLPGQYAALSYCWASLEGTRDIILCGHKTSVTKNLWEAVRQFRSERVPIRIWMDAVCINQDDVMERSSQVGLMRDVYSMATAVLVWLGPATPQTEIAFGFLNFIMSFDSVDVSLDEMPGEFNTAAHFLALGEIFRNVYWRRRWTTQETHVARSMSIHCGTFSIGPYSNLNGCWLRHVTQYTDSCQAIARRHLREGNTLYKTVLAETSAVSSALIVYVDPIHAENPSHLNGFFRTEASVAHDYVYGLLGLLPEDIGIIPSYSLSVGEVFADFAFRFMKRFGMIQLLHLANHNASDIPSWTPDFRHQMLASVPMLPGDSNKGSGATEIPGYKIRLLGSHESLYNASAGSSCGIRSRKGDVLAVSGLVVDRIIALGDVMNDPVDSRGDLVQTFKLLARWQDLYQKLSQEGALDNQAVRYDNHFQFMMDFVFTVCADISQDFNDPHRPWRRCPRAEFEEYMLGLFWEPSSYPEGITWEDMKLRLTWIDLLAARNTFFITSSGRMGLAPGEIRVGDHICILAGMRMPVRLRGVQAEGQSRFTYHEPVYVQGELHND